jgi:hypothetical protein
LALSDFALFEQNKTRLVGSPSETEDNSLAQMRYVGISMSADAGIPVFKEHIERLPTYIRRNGDHVPHRTFFFLPRESISTLVPRFQVIMTRSMVAVSDIDGSVGQIDTRLDDLEIWLISIESRIGDETIDLTAIDDAIHELDGRNCVSYLNMIPKLGAFRIT